MLQFDVTDLNGTTTISATENNVIVKKISIPTVVFDVLINLDAPTPNKLLQQMMAEAAGWKLNDKGRCTQAAALLERITPGYGVFKKTNGVIAVLTGTSSGKHRFYSFNQSLAVESTAKMLTRQGLVKAVAQELLESDSFQDDEESA